MEKEMKKTLLILSAALCFAGNAEALFGSSKSALYKECDKNYTRFNKDPAKFVEGLNKCQTEPAAVAHFAKAACDSLAKNPATFYPSFSADQTAYMALQTILAAKNQVCRPGIGTVTKNAEPEPTLAAFAPPAVPAAAPATPAAVVPGARPVPPAPAVAAKPGANQVTTAAPVSGTQPAAAQTPAALHQFGMRH